MNGLDRRYESLPKEKNWIGALQWADAYGFSGGGGVSNEYPSIFSLWGSPGWNRLAPECLIMIIQQWKSELATLTPWRIRWNGPRQTVSLKRLLLGTWDWYKSHLTINEANYPLYPWNGFCPTALANYPSSASSPHLERRNWLLEKEEEKNRFLDSKLEKEETASAPHQFASNRSSGYSTSANNSNPSHSRNNLWISTFLNSTLPRSVGPDSDSFYPSR